MKLLVISHKPCWVSPGSPSGYATDGGFPFQMRTLSELFDSTVLVVPCSFSRNPSGEIFLTGHNLSVIPLSPHSSRGILRKVLLPFWLVRNSFVLIRQTLRADGVHTPIPGDIGTIGMLLALMSGKPLFIRHCGNWLVQRTIAEHFWKWFMERFAGGKNVMLATGGGSKPPSPRNPAIRWIFATSLTEQELKRCAGFANRAPKEDVRLIIVCRQERIKGTGILIKSLPFILKDFPGVYLDIVGDGGALEEFKKLAATLEVSNRVSFYGKVDRERVIQLLKQADLFCYPTAASEGFPKVVLEALACGLPVVTTPVSALPQIIGTGCGLLIEETTPTTVALAVKEILSDGEVYQAMSAQAVKTAGEYSLERWQKEIGQILKAEWGSLYEKRNHHSKDVGKS